MHGKLSTESDAHPPPAIVSLPGMYGAAMSAVKVDQPGMRGRGAVAAAQSFVEKRDALLAKYQATE